MKIRYCSSSKQHSKLFHCVAALSLIDWSTAPFVFSGPNCFGTLISSTGFCSINFNWSLPHQLFQLTHFYNWSSPTQLQLAFADSTSTTALHNVNCINWYSMVTRVECFKLQNLTALTLFN